MKQKVKKMKYHEDGKLKKVVERETDYMQTLPDRKEIADISSDFVGGFEDDV